MPAPIAFDDLEVGFALPERTYSLTREDLVRYAGASGDLNAIHWNERAARDVGLPGVIAHGMITMAVACRLVTDWIGDPGAVVDYGVRFSSPLVVPDTAAGATITVSGVVGKKLDGGQAVVNLTVRSEGTKVLMGAKATVQLSSR